MSFQGLNRGIALSLVVIGGLTTASTRVAWSQTEITRKTRTKVSPTYPELARRLNLSGVVRIEVTVSAKGEVSSTKIVGGHPVLAAAAVDAVKRWRFEAAAEPSSGIIEVRFNPVE